MCFYFFQTLNQASTCQNLTFQPFARIVYKEERNGTNKTFDTAIHIYIYIYIYAAMFFTMFHKIIPPNLNEKFIADYKDVQFAIFLQLEIFFFGAM